MRRYLIVSDSIISRRRRNKDKISYMSKKNNTLSNLPDNRINAHVSRTLCVQAGTPDMSVADPQGDADHSLRTAAL